MDAGAPVDALGLIAFRLFQHGPNISPSGVALAMAAGATFRAGG